MSTNEPEVAEPSQSAYTPLPPLNTTTLELQQQDSPVAVVTTNDETQPTTPATKRKRKRNPFWARWGVKLPPGGVIPWFSNDFYWVTEKLRYKGYCFKAVQRCPTIDRKNMEMAWAQFCLLKARKMRMKSVKTEEEFEKLSEKLSRAIYQIEGDEDFDIVTFWATHRTVAEVQYGIDVGIQSDFDYAATLLPENEIIKSKHQAKDLDETLQKELLDTRLTEEEKFDFELADIEDGFDGLMATDEDEDDDIESAQKNDEDEDEEEEDEDGEEEEIDARENHPAKRKRGEERAPTGYDDEGKPFWEAEDEVYEDDDSDIDDLPEETEQSAPKRQKLSQNLLNQISQSASAYVVPPNTERNSLSLPVPHPISPNVSTPATNTSQNKSSLAHPSKGHQKSNQNQPSPSPRPPRAPKRISEANATPLGNRPSLPPLPHTLRKISEAKPTPTGDDCPPIDVLDMEGAFDALSVRPPSPAPK